MATSTIKSNRIKAVNVSGTVARTAGASATITAPSKSGYTFVAWVSVATSGWYGNVYAENSANASTKVYVNNVGTLNNNQGGFVATALYQAD